MNSVSNQGFALTLAGLLLLTLVSGCNSTKSSGKPENPLEKQDANQVRRPMVKLPDVQPTSSQQPVNQMDEEQLIDCLGDVDLDRRLEASERLVEAGDASISALIEALAAENYHVRAGAAFTLGQFGDRASSAHATLIQLSTSDEREAVRSAAAFAAEAIRSADQK